MAQSRTLFIGMDGHKDSIAVASVAQEHHAEVISLGAIGTRQCAIDQLIRTMPSKRSHLVLVYEAGRVGIGSTAISPTQAMSAGWSRPR